MMIIRKATQSDTEFIVENNMCLALETEGREIDKKLVQKGVKNVFFHKENGFYIVAEGNKDIIGQIFVTIEWSDWRNQSIWWLHRIYVKNDYRHQGVFSALLHNVFQLAECETVYALRLYMMTDNETAENIYKHFGFERTPFLILQNKKKCE